MRRLILISALVSLSVAAAHAQVALYVTSSSARFSNTQTVSTSFWTSSIGGGISTTYIPMGPVNLSFDLRGSARPGTPGSDTGLIGVKLASNAPALRIKPYLQASGGYVKTRSVDLVTSNTLYSRYAAWEILGGLDYPIAHSVDLRVIEFGGGAGYHLNGASGPSL